ncbi:hypothetical protein COX09_00920 [Candidatus Beckwithbacteria bacterium CG23_combo_of_CG06-09_8_20_14_all_47_9]|uniref:Ribbon-helix-helix protein CopG domain-containing protein n=1 Tax=Candidatus Beckwithbacteria bacterium CG23_combo_of_CG06-09_8_20_14_all_47_9 TaxID=1974498 RepID=A0A2H0B4H9_9BACT|nr:MAG: hypothetical protein COX09_00920 [Candidatus Beckwithbacteria bacterium CG23_combo_of_CG06-09_8_20_14_all_47_9]
MAKFAIIGDMATINISLPNTLALQLDELVNRFAFANRSEFIRSLLRRFFSDQALLQEGAVFPFVVPRTKSRKKIVSEFKKTGKYSPGFLEDLNKGLKNSRYFKD